MMRCFEGGDLGLLLCNTLGEENVVLGFLLFLTFNSAFLDGV
jgi:hypothetical protein